MITNMRFGRKSATGTLTVPEEKEKLVLFLEMIQKKANGTEGQLHVLLII